MLTVDDLAGLAPFADVPAAELDRLARAAADVHLAEGEFLVHEGDTRALFVVVSGRVELSKLFGGEERVIGARLPGKVYGEVPIVFGTQMQATARATEPSRVLRIDPAQYYALAGASPKFAQYIGALALERLGGLQGIASEPPKPQAIVLGDRWDPVAQELRRFLSRNQILFEWVPLDDPELATRWGTPPDPAELPALRFPDGTLLFRPELRRLAALLRLRTSPGAEAYDTVIVGGGPAGLAAAVYGASEGLSTLVVECEAPGGQAETSSRIENYLGFPSGISGDELANRALRQARRLGAEILITRRTTGIDTAERIVHLDGDEAIRARTIILAIGVNWRRIQLDGFDRLIGKGIYYGASRSEASVTQGQEVYLIGAGNSAGQAALHFANHASTVTLVVRGPDLERSMSQYLIEQIRTKENIRVALRSEVVAVHGKDHLTAIDLADRMEGTVGRADCAALFVCIGADAETAWLPPEIARDPRGYVLTGPDVEKSGRWKLARDPYLLETSVPGIFACGDVRASPVKRVASAVGEGSMSIAFVHQYLALEAAAAEEVPAAAAGLP
jgi:thioredoxin reductase (NADPH)